MKKAIFNNIFYIVIAGYLSYGLYLIWQSSYVLQGVRYFTLFDDEMISMRYARHLAEGKGLVWNVGERIEGITNPLWTIIMAIVHLFPIPSNLTSFFIQLISLFCMVGVLFMVRKIYLLISPNKSLSLAVVVLTAFYYPLVNWTVILGTEVSLLLLLITGATYFLFLSIQKKSLSLKPFMLMSIAILVRMDSVVPVVVLIAASFYFFRKRYFKKLILGIIIVLAFLSSLELFRSLYYKDLLPNTYYLKMTGFPLLPRITRGIYVLKDTLNWLLLLIPAIYVILQKDKRVIVLMSLFLAQVVYSVYVGGDAWEQFGGANRYIAVGIPFFFIALLVSLDYLFSFLKLKNLFQKKLIGAAFLFVIFLSLHLKNDTMLIQLLLLRPPRTVGENQLQTRLAQAVNKRSNKEAVVGVVWAGIIPYYTERKYLDLLGKNDRRIARMEILYWGKELTGFSKYISFFPGHMKWDTRYVMQKNPDLFIQTFPESESKSILSKKYDKYYDKDGLTLVIRKDSDLISREGLRTTSF